VRKQQNISRGAQQTGSEAGSRAETRLDHLLHLAADFKASLDNCSSSGEAEAVHQVRTGSRRLQAMVETMLREGSAKTRLILEEPARLWLRQLKGLRRMAGPVRDLDVHRKLLKKPLADWMKRAAAEKDGDRPGEAGVFAAKREAVQLSGQAGQLDTWLKNERHRRAEALGKHLEKHRQKLADREATFISAAKRIRTPRGKASRSAAVVALYDFARLADATPVLDPNNLHDFRKSVKKARYVAESGGDEWNSQTVAQALKRIQDVIGTWHDWLCLADEGKAALGESSPELAAWLAIETDRHFAGALATTERMRGKLLGEWIATHGRTRERRPENESARKPPSRAATAIPAKENRAG
jgi:CHAD domain-containing protein